ncbi:alpha/beta hydrolase fold family protein [Cladophialophora carrionii]|uniref:Alpha/beta hydrolase fold family protein n=1 Tax=Cladophialophora carrionii TaxID=86049 RepID=A0A1C1CC96_9EURO|nr:alpha/beta hydrolase fold family protein [Cladophialophora carrionii]
MTIRKNNPWETKSEISGLIPLPERDVSLSAHASGPPRHHGEPVVILFTGAGAPAATYVKVQQRLSRFVRTLFYDRAGYDRSTLPSNGESLTAHNTAHDLDALLEKIGVSPPYILVGHSYGGIPLREFLHLQLTKHRPPFSPLAVIAGVVLYDTGTEVAFALFPRIPSADLVAVTKDVDWEGLTHLRQESGMTDDEWDYAIEAGLRTATKLATKRQDTHASARSLAERRQFENHTYRSGNVVVIRCNSVRDYQRMYDEGVRLGGGTEEERRGATKFIEDCSLHTYTMVKAQVDLVDQHGNALYRELMDWGHDSPFRNPDLVGDAVKWVLDELRKQEESH